MKCWIYPSKEQFREATEAYLAEYHEEFFGKFSEIRWTSFYDKHIYQKVCFLSTIYFK